MRIGGGGSDRLFGIVVPTRGERSPNASERSWAPLNAAAEQPTNARGEGPTGLAAIPRNENGPLIEGPGSFGVERRR